MLFKAVKTNFSKTAFYCGGSGSTGANVLPLLEEFWLFNISAFVFLSELLSVGRFQLQKGDVASRHAPITAEQHVSTSLVTVGLFVAGSCQSDLLQIQIS